MTIIGTAKCFDDALEIISLIVTKEPKLAHGTELILCHGLGINSINEVFAHGWVEFRGVAIWRGILDGSVGEFATPIEEYRKQWQLNDVTEYTCYQAYMENLKSGHFGPWIERYEIHTSERKREQKDLPDKV